MYTRKPDSIQHALFLIAVLLTSLWFSGFAFQPLYAAPAPGSMGGGAGGGGGAGMGPVCPPACPPSPANCDANLVISPAQALQFGSLSAPFAGTVTVDPNGVRTSSGGIVLLTGGTVSAASFTMTTGLYNCSAQTLASITVASPATLNHVSSSATMTVDTFTTNPVSGDTFDPAIPLLVGGTLNVGTMQSAGSYTGTFSITVNFQ